KARTIALEPLSCAAQHAMREIDAGDFGFGIGIFEDVLGELTGSTADIENRSHSAEIELPRTKYPLPKGDMQREITARRKQRSLRSAVDIVNLVAVLLVADLLDEVILDDAIDDLPRLLAR